MNEHPALCPVLALLNPLPGSPLETPEAISALVASLSGLLDNESQCKLSLFISGFILETLQVGHRALLEHLLQLETMGRLEVLSGLFYEPHPALASAEDLSEQLKYSDDFWTNLRGTPPRTICEFTTRKSPYGLVVRPCSENELLSSLLGANTSRGVNTVLLDLSRFCVQPERNAAEDLSQMLSVLYSRARDRGTRLALASECGFARDENSIPLPLLLSPEPPPSFPLDQSSAPVQYLAALRRRLEAARESIEQNSAPQHLTERLSSAKRYFLQAQYFPLTAVADEQDFFCLSRAFYRRAVSASVELDAVIHYDIDPVQGWLEREPHELRRSTSETLLVETPFLRAKLDASSGGTLTELFYKPRKTNLLNFAGHRGSCHGVLATGHFDSPPSKSSIRLLRAQRDLLVCRAVQPLCRETNEMEAPLLFKDFYFRAGVGAHEPMSTAGFHLEYWIESSEEAPHDALFSLVFFWMLPSGDRRCMGARPLISFGGKAAAAVNLEQAARLVSSEVQGGLHGVRLIDAIDGFTVDLRSAKQLAEVEIHPACWLEPSSEDYSVPTGLQVIMSLQARYIWGDERSNSLFVSIC